MKDFEGRCQTTDRSTQHDGHECGKGGGGGGRGAGGVRGSWSLVRERTLSTGLSAEAYNIPKTLESEEKRNCL